ncbi:uncharacterized protein ATNIH1004_009191 [Aspergillus tanneri]|uniref:Uncharacterized protein n=1 Tax=Aspergillus tanneri TaxID=1220188 RepID=A0A5M9MHY7_9EURO|nr:uncharacterized protein ATNIH1004_009191 [Aspergillus tanneri]KAA8644980.1 hypothetical protein ATNIH1004_009191 [Aspergillus tanneri]
MSQYVALNVAVDVAVAMNIEASVEAVGRDVWKVRRRAGFVVDVDMDWLWLNLPIQMKVSDKPAKQRGRPAAWLGITEVEF